MKKNGKAVKVAKATKKAAKVAPVAKVAAKVVKVAAPVAQHDPRTPAVGTTIRKTYKGKDLAVVVLADGFKFNGKVYGSLSGLAEELTGCKRSGYAFFGLLAPATKKASASPAPKVARKAPAPARASRKRA